MAEQKGSEPKKESPSLPGSEPKPANQPTAEEQAKSLLAELGKIGVEKPEQIVNMATASQQVGRVQNLLGSANQRIAQLEAELATVKTRKPQSFDEPNPNGETIDLAKLIRQESKASVREVIQEMNEVQQRIYRENLTIQNDEDYSAVKDVYEQYVRSPEAATRLQAGEATLKDLYGEVKNKLFKEMLKRSQNVITNLTTATKPGHQAIPHVEGNETRSAPTMEPDDQKRDKLKKIDEDRRSGRVSSESALHQLIDQFLPKDDPIWNVRR